MPERASSKARRNEVHSLLSIGCSFSQSFQPPSLRLHDGSCAVRYVQAAQLQSTCSEKYTDEHPRAPWARSGFRKGLHQIELLCRAEGRQSSRNSYSHAAYPRQRASGTSMVQPSRLGIGSCPAESWYVCFPYRHLSWFAVRRSGICLLLCAACAPLCRSALSPWRICERVAQARPHSDSRMDFFVTL